ncbi:hypothetical protein GDO86_004518 [Hymenochirus boettgeri]|uniref:Uncharacterized protein n=1 Tax=Hymenochirus boettgeri TaxID=247094 RepID=A0A8T2K5I1_9PIPI|nr:hypothetical protein GDO86_004518 [Hymenochirus boettgeri]
MSLVVYIILCFIYIGSILFISTFCFVKCSEIHIYTCIFLLVSVESAQFAYSGKVNIVRTHCKPMKWVSELQTVPPNACFDLSSYNFNLETI